MKDILDNKNKEIKCLDLGFVNIIDCMPRLIPDKEESADFAIAEAARCSYQRGTKKISDDRALIRHLMRSCHTSPFEQVEFKFHMKMPIFVARQLIRHRSANVNELSGRFSEMPDEYFLPPLDDIRIQSEKNKQGSDGNFDINNSENILNSIHLSSENSFNLYKEFLYLNMTREQARIVLPLNTYTEWYWKIDLHNLLHFLSLRCDEHSQKETREYAEAILELISPIVPITIEAWEDYDRLRGGISLTKLEIEAIKNSLSGQNLQLFDIDSNNKREKEEWVEKAKKLGF